MNDGMLLQINRQRNLIPEELLRAAQGVQERERAAGKTPRPLLEILATRGDLDSTTVHLIRDLMHRGNPGPNGEDATIVEGFHAVVESRILPPPEPSTASSKAGWPQEVVDAAGDVRNLFGQFVLVAQVGSGGSGIVYRAWDRRVSRYSGVKILHTMEPSALERFTREARIAGNLQHSSIATIYEVGEHEGRYYIAMKYIDGKAIDADPRSIPECLALIRDACRALDYAHKQGIIHRDIKPANLLVDSQDRVYVTDFGIAKQAAHEQTSTLSLTGTIIGTPKYLPPEQARGEAKRADARSDVYSVGATLYTLLAGRPPFPSSNVWETLESVMKREPPPLTSLNAAVSPELERIVAKAMAKDPANRFMSAGLLADELDRILQQRRYTGRYGLLRYLARKWVFAAGLGLAVGILLHWQADRFFPRDEFKERPLDPDETYRVAIERFLTYWNDPSAPTSDMRKAAQQVEPIARVVKNNPSYLPGRVLIMRANFISDRKLALEQYQELKDFSVKDYRIEFMGSLFELDAYLAGSTPPLPAPEAPPKSDPESVDRPDEWFGPIAPPFGRSFTVPAKTEVSTLLAREQAYDSLAGVALSHFSQGNWEGAFQAFGEVSPLPSMYWKAYHRTTYLSRRWDATLKQGDAQHPGIGKCRECFGASLMKALALENPIPALQYLRKFCSTDPSTDLLIRACIARRSVDRGLEPAAPLSSDSGDLRGVIRVAGLRWNALTGSDEEDGYTRALTDLENPVTWIGKLARVEALLSLARRLKLRNLEFGQVAQEAIDRATALGNGGWTAPRVYRGEAYLLTDKDKAFTQLPTKTPVMTDLRACYAWSDLHRRKGDFQDAINIAKRAAELAPDSPVAEYLQAAAILEKAQQEANPGDGALVALDLLCTALEKRPGYIEAQLARASALFLIADWAPMSAAHASSCRLSAEQDLKAVLDKIPNLESALILQKHLRDVLHREPKGGSK